MIYHLEAIGKTAVLVSFFLMLQHGKKSKKVKKVFQYSFLHEKICYQINCSRISIAEWTSQRRRTIFAWYTWDICHQSHTGLRIEEVCEYNRYR